MLLVAHLTLLIILEPYLIPNVESIRSVRSVRSVRRDKQDEGQEVFGNGDSENIKKRLEKVEHLFGLPVESVSLNPPGSYP